MFNEQQKVKFIKDYTGSLNTANVATALFNELEKYEAEWGCDICTKSAEEIEPIIGEIVGLRSSSRWMTLIILREYAKWCIAMRVAGACDGLLNVDAVGFSKMKRQMVTSPLHLKKVLDEIFEPESDETVDNLYRCYFWLAFCGVEEDDVLKINEENIDFKKMEIRYNDRTFPIYGEALSVFKSVVELNSFLYKHPNYSKEVRRERFPGKNIMRGIKTSGDIFTIRAEVSQKNRKAIKKGKTNMEISFGRMKLSGLFYRAYEMERAGIPITFTEAAVRAMNGKNYSLPEGKAIEQIQRRKEREYFEDYLRWKVAFST